MEKEQRTPQLPDSGVDAKTPRIDRRLGAGVLMGVLLLVGAFVAGNVIGDDSDEVRDLESQVAELTSDLEDEESELGIAQDELEESNELKNNLASQLKAEKNLSGDLEEITGESGTGPETDYLAGLAGTVGEFTIKPDVALRSASEEEATWVATIEVKNNGSEPAEIFCGGSEAILLDLSGRSYEGESVLAGDTANCGSSLQPGLTADNYEIEFNLPPDATPAAIEISPGLFEEEPTKSWAVEVEG